MHWPDAWLDLLASQRMREREQALRSARPLPAGPGPSSHTLPPHGWRHALWSVGHTVEGIGQRIEAFADADGRA
jgi:hypothetical protein